MNTAGATPDPQGIPRVTSAGFGRVTMSIPSAQTIALRIDHLVEEIVTNTGALRRSLPDVAAEVLEMCGRAGADAAKMERTLTRDPFISAQVVSIANSAMFAPRMPILSVRDAVVRIGLDAVRDVVVMVVANSTMFRVRGFERQVEGFRRGMLASASSARFLAKAVRAESEYGFLAGLLHDIGELVLLERCAQDGLITAAAWDDQAEGALVRERIHAHHTAVGSALCRSWKLPTGVIDAAQFHHDYKSGGKNHLAAHLVAASDVLCDYVLPGCPPPEVAASEQPVLKELGLTAAQIQSVIDQAKPALAGLLGVK
ncbi:MAG: HDOD domain-containing protein [Deltaproteobacteria bacterium]|nr:HDOD domain-containing protein [Deltaproteobacteria bacterium]